MNVLLRQCKIKRLIQSTFYIVLSIVTLLAFAPNYNALPDFVSFSDLLNHTLAFIVLTVLLDMAHHLKLSIRISLGLFYAVFIEFVQHFLPNRFSSLSDILADSVGIILAIFLIKLLRHISLCNICYNSVNKRVN